jgi:hypothetical protein
VFDVYAADQAVEVNEQLLVRIVKVFPFGAGVKELPDLFAGLMTLLDDPERFECIVLPAVEMFTRILMDKSDEFDIAENVLRDMKATLRRLVRENRSLEAKLAAPYRSSRTKMARFKMLLR